jgi:hypothetical protein
LPELHAFGNINKNSPALEFMVNFDHEIWPLSLGTFPSSARLVPQTPW